MKKNLLRIVCILMALFMLPVYAFAAEAPAQEEALTGAAAINYVQKNADFVGSEYRTVTTSQNNRLEFRVDTYTKTEPVGLTRSGVTEYKTTTYQIYNRSSGQQYDDNLDPRGYILFTLTVYHTDFVYNNANYRRMTSVSGSYTPISPGAEVASQSYTVAVYGVPYPGGAKTDQATYSLSKTQRSWSASINSSRFPGMLMGGLTHYQRVEYNFTLSSTEFNDSWDGYLRVNAYEAL